MEKTRNESSRMKWKLQKKMVENSKYISNDNKNISRLNLTLNSECQIE